MRLTVILQRMKRENMSTMFSVKVTAEVEVYIFKQMLVLGKRGIVG